MGPTSASPILPSQRLNHGRHCRSKRPRGSGTPAYAGAWTCTRVKMFWYSAMASASLCPDGKVEPPVPPFRPPARPEGTADDDAHRAPEAGHEREEQPEAVDAERADGVADGVAEERVLVLRRLHRLALLGIDRGQHERAVQRQREDGGEEERHRQHVRRVVVEVQVLVARV